MASLRRFLTNRVEQRASFDLLIDYTQNPVPPLAEPDAGWVDALLNSGVPVTVQRLIRYRITVGTVTGTTSL